MGRSNDLVQFCIFLDIFSVALERLTIYLHLIRIFIIIIPILSLCHDLGVVIGISNVLPHLPETTQSRSSLSCPSSAPSQERPFLPLISSSHPSLTHSLRFHPWASVLLFFKASVPSLDFLLPFFAATFCRLLGNGFHTCHLQPSPTFLSPAPHFPLPAGHFHLGVPTTPQNNWK